MLARGVKCGSLGASDQTDLPRLIQRHGPEFGVIFALVTEAQTKLRASFTGEALEKVLEVG